MSMRGNPKLLLYFVICMAFLCLPVFAGNEVSYAAQGHFGLYDASNSVSLHQVSNSAFNFFATLHDGEWVYYAGKESGDVKICKYNSLNYTNRSCSDHFFATTVEFKSLMIIGDYLYFGGTSYGIGKAPLNNLSQVTRIFSHSPTYSVTFDGRDFYVGGYGNVIRYNEETGITTTLPLEDSLIIRDIVQAKNYVYAGDQSGKVHRISKDTFQKEGELSYTGAVFALAVGGDYFYTTNIGDDYVRVYDLNLNYLGKSHWLCAGDPRALGVTDDYVVCGSSNGYMRIFNKTIDGDGLLQYKNQVHSLKFVYDVSSGTCSEDWQPYYTGCVNNRMLKRHYDTNSCGTFRNYPVDTEHLCGYDYLFTDDFESVKPDWELSQGVYHDMDGDGDNEVRLASGSALRLNHSINYALLANLTLKGKFQVNDGRYIPSAFLFTDNVFYGYSINTLVKTHGLFMTGNGNRGLILKEQNQGMPVRNIAIADGGGNVFQNMWGSFEITLNKTHLVDIKINDIVRASNVYYGDTLFDFSDTTRFSNKLQFQQRTGFSYYGWIDDVEFGVNYLNPPPVIESFSPSEAFSQIDSVVPFSINATHPSGIVGLSMYVDGAKVLENASTISGVPWEFDYDFTSDGTYDVYFEASAEGAGSSQSSTIQIDIHPMVEIDTCEELQNMSNQLYRHYVLTADVDCDVAPYNADLGFDPIGNSSAPFKGSFNGANYSISGLYVNRQSRVDGGLFGTIGDTGDVRDVTLLSPIVQASYTNRGDVGGVVGLNYGYVYNVKVNGGRIESRGINEVYQTTGGVVGENRGIIDHASCQGAYVYCGLASGATYWSEATGGFAGRNDGGVIRYSSSEDCRVRYHNSNINLHAGGFVGMNYYSGIIHDSWVKSDIIALGDMGALGGFTMNNVGNLTNVYAYGVISGGDPVKMGTMWTTHRDDLGATFSAAKSAVTGGSCLDGASCVSFASLQNQTNYPTYDFDHVWYWDSSANLPRIRGTCVEDWQPVFESCNIDDTGFKTYYDASSCGTTYDVPEDNGTMAACNYCSEAIVAKQDPCGYYDDPEGFFVRDYYVDNNYRSCCAVTGLATDCSIHNSPFSESTYTDCSPHSDFLQTMTCDTENFTEHGVGDDKSYWLCTLPESVDAKCVAFVKDHISGVVQVNPQYEQRQGSRYFVPEKVEDRKSFTASNGLVSVYFTKENLLFDGRDYLYSVRCSSATDTYTFGKVVTPQYSNINEPTTRLFWLKGNMVALVAGVFLLILIAIAVGALVSAMRR